MFPAERQADPAAGHALPLLQQRRQWGGLCALCQVVRIGSAGAYRASNLAVGCGDGPGGAGLVDGRCLSIREAHPETPGRRIP